MSLETITTYCWETYTPRTLVSGTPDAPTNRAQYIAKAIWENAERTLGGGPTTPVVGTVRLHQITLE